VPPRVVPKRGVERHPELGLRREAAYPAYAATHTRIHHEVRLAHEAMTAALPEIGVPVLLVASEADPWCPPPQSRWILERLRTERRELLVVEEPGHAISRDPARAEAVRATERFVDSL
jgi:pimeloyl-ACP methyl ester carboxylesterase